MKKLKIFILVIIILIGIYYFIPKTIRSCGVLPGGLSCGDWKCERGFAIEGFGKPACLLGGEPILILK